MTLLCMGEQWYFQKTCVIKEKSQCKVWDMGVIGQGGPSDLCTNTGYFLCPRLSKITTC